MVHLQQVAGELGTSTTTPLTQKGNASSHVSECTLVCPDAAIAQNNIRISFMQNAGRAW